MKEDVIVRMVDIPEAVNGFASPSPDSAYNVYLNSKQSHETQVSTLLHELSHIENDDFSSEKDVADIENDIQPKRPILALEKLSI